MRLGVVCEALTDPDGFAWTTSIIDEKCLVFGFSLSGTTPSIIDSLLDAQDMGAKTVLFTSSPNKDTQAFTETIFGRKPKPSILYSTNFCPDSNADYH